MCSCTASRAAIRSPTASMLWTHVTSDAAVPVEWTVARDEKLRDVLAEGAAEATRDADGTVHVDVDGLEPGDAPTSTASARSVRRRRPGAPARCPPTHEHVRLAMVSCAKFNAGFFNAYARIAERTDLDFLLHLGDYIYEASNTPPKSQTPGADIGRPFDPLHECVTLADYRTRYRQYRARPRRAASARRAPRDRDARRPRVRRRRVARRRRLSTSPSTDRGPSGGPTRSARGRSGCRCAVPTPAIPSGCGDGVPIGDLADLFLIDTRTRRDEPVPEPAMSDPSRTALGPEQREWLLEALDASTRGWRLLANPSVMGQTWNPALPDDVRDALRKVKLLADDMLGPDFDQWDGYPAEREALFDHVRRPRDREPRRAQRRRPRVARARAAPAARSTATDHSLGGRVRDAEPHVAEPRRQDGPAASRCPTRVRSSSAPSSSCRTGSGSISTATATSSSTSRPSGSPPSGGTSTPCSSGRPARSAVRRSPSPTARTASNASTLEAQRAEIAIRRHTMRLVLPVQ